jgi:hypothetical protein
VKEFSIWIRLDNNENWKRTFLLKKFENKDSRLAAKVGRSNTGKASLYERVDKLF